jgi:hypothetical protein
MSTNYYADFVIKTTGIFTARSILTRNTAHFEQDCRWLALFLA